MIWSDKIQKLLKLTSKILKIITFEEYISIALDAPRVVGIYPEIKNPVFINQRVSIFLKENNEFMFRNEYIRIPGVLFCLLALMVCVGCIWQEICSCKFLMTQLHWQQDTKSILSLENFMENPTINIFHSTLEKLF